MATIGSEVHLNVLQGDGQAGKGSAQIRKGLRLTDLREGETARVLRVAMKDVGCKKRLAELGVAPGMKITLLSMTGGQVMLQVGGSKMGLGEGCAAEISVMRG